MLNEKNKIVFAVLVLASIFSIPAFPGTYVEQIVTSSGDGMNMQVNAWTDGSGGRIEFAESDHPILPKGSYIITNDNGKTAYLVNPEKETYSVWDLNALFSTFGQYFEAMGNVMKISFEDVESETLPLEPGGQILGYDTTINGWHNAYTMKMKIMTMEKKQRTESKTQAWVASAIKNPTLGIWFAIKPPSTGNPEMDQMFSSGMGKIDGTPLKIINESTSKDDSGKGSSQKVTMEVTAYREESVGPEKFKMPQGYEEVPLVDLENANSKKKDKGSGDGNPLKGLGDLLKGLQG